METEPPNQPQPPAEPTPATPAAQPRRFNRTAILVLGVVVIVVAIVFWSRRSHTSAKPAAPFVVGVVKVAREDVYNEVSIPAEFRPYVEVDLHAKVSGYVDKMNVDFGDKVKAGQLLATIEVPELHDQLNSALAMQQKEEVDYTNTNLIYTRLLSVNKEHPNLVAQQELDTAESKNYAAAAAIAGAKADVARYQTLVKYTQITAPFDGVITKRSADPGTLVQAGTATENTSPLLRVSDNYHLRLDFDVSDMYVKDIRPGQSVKVRVEALNNKTFTGKITRFTDKVNLDTRTMMTEMEVENPDLEIVPGMYAAVALQVQHHTNVLTVPVQAVSGDKNPTVYLVDDNSEIVSQPVTLGLETAEKYEITSGLQEGESVMIGNRAFVHPGQKVQTKTVTLPPTP